MTPLTVVEVLRDPTVNCLEPRLNVPAPAIEPKEVPPVVRSAILTSPPALLMTRRLIAAARVDEFNEPATTGNERRMVSSARIVKFDGRTIQRRDRRMISRAVVMELYETGVEAPVFRNWTASIDSRCASTAVVKEVHVALDDGEGCVAGGARVEKIRYPEVGVDRCIAGAAPVVELYQPTAGDGGVAGGGPCRL